MKTPRNVSAKELIKKLKTLGYEVTRQTGSHMRFTTMQKGEHHITIPNHDLLRIGTFSSIISDVALHFGKTKQDLINELF
jgi:predicted RNA binding protein YcfA (HicA-like mRNA interferase family)